MLRLISIVMMFSVAWLSGCGGSSSSGGGAGNTSLDVTPSLGMITNATVKLFQSDGTTLLATGDTGTSGVVSIDYPSDYTGPVIVVVAGDSDAQYYDEASGSMQSFPDGSLLRAMVPAGSTQTAVTTLTEVAYQLAQENQISLTDANINTLNERVRTALAPELSSILSAPFMFDGNTTAGDLLDDEAGRYALKLAALAQLGASDATPALTIARQLAADYSDGKLDGIAGSSGAQSGLLYSTGTINQDLRGALTIVANKYGSSALQKAILVYDNIGSIINLTGFESGSSSGSGAALGNGVGITGTVGSNQYTFTGTPGDESYSNLGTTVFIASSSDFLSRWDISGFTPQAGTQSCGSNGALPRILLLVNGVIYSADQCTIEIISANGSDIEGRFSAHLINAIDSSELGTVTDGYFRYYDSGSGTSGSNSGLPSGSYGAVLDIDDKANDWTSQTIGLSNSAVAIAGTGADTYLGLWAGSVDYGLQLRMIKINQPGIYVCGQGSNSYRLPEMWVYLGNKQYVADAGTAGSSCTIDVTTTGTTYEGTFSGTLIADDGATIAVTNGQFRTDASSL